MMKIATGAVVLAVMLTGCSPRTESASTAPKQSTITLHQYIVDNKISELRIRRGEPGTPKVDFADPPGWSSAGDRTPDWAYGAIVYDKPTDPDDPPYVIAIGSKLSGDIDPAKVLEYAPAQLNDLPEFEPRGKPTRSSFSGFDAIDYVGTFVGKGQRRAIGQITIVVPGEDALFVLQLNAVAPQGEEQVVTDAVNLIVNQTRISA